MNVELEPDCFGVAGLVQQYDQIRTQRVVESFEKRRTTLDININVWAFMRAVCDIYRETQTSFLNDLLRVACNEFFYQLSPQMRKQVAELADKLERIETSQVVKEAGYEDRSQQQGPGLWTALAMAYEQRDAEKQLQDQQEGVK